MIKLGSKFEEGFDICSYFFLFIWTQYILSNKHTAWNEVDAS